MSHRACRGWASEARYAGNMSAALPAITDIRDEDLARWLAERGEPAYRLKQIRRSVARSVAAAWSGLTDLPLALRSALADAFRWSSVELEREIASADGETRKALLRLHDGHHIESVLMPHHGQRNSVCISTQAGCPMACAFCATGEMGLIRDLSVGEIVDQVRHWERELKARDDRVSHVVYMGMGEPLRNYGPVMASVRMLADPDLFGISPRRITISTCGIVPKMDALAASARYVERTKRRLTFEYILLAGVNDAPADADLLGRAIVERCTSRGSAGAKPPPGSYHVNLIPVNPGPGSFERPSPERMERFARTLERHGVAATVRISKGQDIAAGCGQLKVAEGKATYQAIPMEVRL